MSAPSRTVYLALAVAVHVGVLWGIHFGPPAFISSEEEPGDAIEVGLVEAAEASPEPPTAAPEPPAPPEPPPPEPPPPTPPEPQPMTEPPPPKPDAIPEPTPAPTPPPQPPKPRPTPKAAPKPAPRSEAPASSAPKASAATPGKSGTSAGSPGSGSRGKPGRGDAASASWRNRVRPAYPSAARAAGQAGRVLIIANVNALGRAVSARVYKSSGFPALDQAALSAARASTYHPKRIAGLPLPDTITIPYTFRIEDR